MKITDTHIYFWGSIYSNFQGCHFTLDGIEFNCSEQAFMYYKAKHFNDDEIATEILSRAWPEEQKKLGKQVRGFNEEAWSAVRYDYMLKVVYAKFSQNDFFKREILSTGTRIFVEASPYDKVWGVGLREDDPLILDSLNWQGQNLLGQVLIQVREQLRAQVV